MYTVLVTQYSINIINNSFDKDIEIGKIHSIFKNSINLKFDFGFINFIKEEYQQLPFSIEIEEDILNSILDKCKVGDRVRLDRINRSLTFDDINTEIIFVSNPYNCLLEKCTLNKSVFKNNFYKVQEFIVNCGIENGFGLDNKLFLELINDIVQNGEEIKEYKKDDIYKKLEIDFVYFIKKLLNSATDNSSNSHIFDYFIGRGKGLTPSGDDLMLGLISMLKVVDKDNISKDLLLYLKDNGIKRTTDISLEYLKYACMGSVGKNIKNLCECLTNSEYYIEKYLYKLSNKGHSSGVDTILGIYLAMVILIKYFYKRGEIKWDIQMIY